jgi:hypothetical protein
MNKAILNSLNIRLALVAGKVVTYNMDDADLAQ